MATLSTHQRKKIKVEVHKLINQQFKGYGSWKQCKNCGTSKHSRLWWLGGYTSETEPPCSTDFRSEEIKNWLISASRIDN